MRIALFTTTTDMVPPFGKVIHAPLWLTYHLANGLAKKHDVSLFAIPGSKTKATLVSNSLTDWPRNKTAKAVLKDGLVGTHRRFSFLNDQTLLSEAYSEKSFDIVHANTELALPLAALSKTPTLITYHSVYNDYYAKVFSWYQKKYPNIFFNALSEQHQKQAPSVSFSQTVYNGIDTSHFSHHKTGGNYLLYAGRLLKEKGVDTAIQAAIKAKQPIKLIGERFTPDGARLAFWKKHVEPSLHNNLVSIIGLVPHLKTVPYYQKAKALLLPDRIEEPFGLVMGEAMSCGTPVIAFNKGAVPELIKHGVTGFVVRNKREMITAVKKIYGMPDREYQEMRRAARAHVEQNFSIERMVENYEKLYHDIVDKHKKSHAKIRTS